MTKRIKLAVIMGGILGVFCIIGAASRLGWQGNQLRLFALWYNRLLMGFLIGLAGNWILLPGKWNWVIRGGGLGLLVSAAYFFTSGASDWVSFLAGIVYGLIIEAVVRRYPS